jgi:hypothetical protein
MANTTSDFCSRCNDEEVRWDIRSARSGADQPPLRLASTSGSMSILLSVRYSSEFMWFPFPKWSNTFLQTLIINKLVNK